MDNNPIGILLLLPLFLIFFSGIWMTVLAFISFAGGWNSLAQQYANSEKYAGKLLKAFSLCSLRLSFFATYSNSINISLHENGLLIRPLFLFRFMHKPLFFPWDKIEHVEKSNMLFSSRYKVQVNLREFQLYGRAGEEVYAFYQHFLKA